MKICPKCNQTYSDDTQNFCLQDGSTLSRLNQTADSRIEAPTIIHGEKVTADPHITGHGTVAQPDNTNKNYVFKLIGAALVLFLVLVLGISLAVNFYQLKDYFISILNPEPSPTTPTPQSSPSETNEAKEKRAVVAVMEKGADAILKRDVDALDDILAEEYVETYSPGQSFSRSQALTLVATIQRKSLDNTINRIEIEGNRATVSGRGVSRVVELLGEQTYRYQFETELKKRDGRWQVTRTFIKY
ncbi:MAG: nuclear transport factor 2 family protein [Pyrinomonadaceae bacterium]